MINGLMKGRRKIWRRSAAFFLAISAVVIAKFVFDGWSAFAEWSLMDAQLFMAFVFAFSVWFLSFRFSRPCIVCRSDNIEASE